MADLSDFKRGQIVGTCMVGTNVTKTVQIFGISRGNISKVMIDFKKKRKCLSKAHIWPKAVVVRKNF